MSFSAFLNNQLNIVNSLVNWIIQIFDVLYSNYVFKILFYIIVFLVIFSILIKIFNLISHFTIVKEYEEYENIDNSSNVNISYDDYESDYEDDEFWEEDL